jgi:hypothetical protein
MCRAISCARQRFSPRHFDSHIATGLQAVRDRPNDRVDASRIDIIADDHDQFGANARRGPCTLPGSRHPMKAFVMNRLVAI